MSNSNRRRFAASKPVPAPVTAPVTSPLKRIEELEAGLSMVMQICTNLQGNGERIERVLEAVEGILGPDKVQDSLDAIYRKRQEDNIALALAEGKIEPATEAGPGTLIVAFQVGADGNPLRPGMVHVRFDTLLEAPKAAFLGQGPGTTWVAENGSQLVISQVYRFVPPPASVPTVFSEVKDPPAEAEEAALSEGTT